LRAGQNRSPHFAFLWRFFLFSLPSSLCKPSPTKSRLPPPNCSDLNPFFFLFRFRFFRALYSPSGVPFSLSFSSEVCLFSFYDDMSTPFPRGRFRFRFLRAAFTSSHFLPWWFATDPPGGCLFTRRTFPFRRGIGSTCFPLAKSPAFFPLGPSFR